MNVIHYSRCRMVPTPSSLAAQLGYLHEVASFTPNPAIRIEYGDYDHRDDRYWMRHAGCAKSLFARSRGADTRAVAFSSCEAGERIYVAAGSDICSPADLRGRRIALPLIAGRLFDVDRQVYLKPFHTALNNVGLALSDVDIVNTHFERRKLCDAPPEARNFFEEAGEIFLDQLRRGDVDAIAMPVRPNNVSDIRVLYDSRDDKAAAARGELRTLTVSGPLLCEYRDVVVSCVAALLRASVWATVHPGDISRLVAKDLGLSEDALLRRDIDFESWSRVGCTEFDLNVLEGRAELLHATGAIEAVVSIGDWVDMTILRDANHLLATRNPLEARP